MKGLTGVVAAAAALVAFGGVASAQDKVVLYTAHKTSLVQTLAPVFEKETGIKTEVIQLGSGEVFRRVRAEARAPKADVIWSVSGSLLTENADLLEPYKAKDAASIDPRFVKSEAWTPYTAVIYVLMQNTRMVKDTETPKTLADLADPKWKGKIASARADNSGSAFQQMMTVLSASGADGWNKYGEIAKNFVLTDSSGSVPRYVADGETPLGLTLEDNALEYKVGGAPVKLAYLADGTTAAPDGVALVKEAPNAENGKKFIDWALSKKTQELLVKEAGRRSVRPDVAGPGDVTPLGDLKLIELKSVEELGGTQAVLEKWRKAVGQ
ncbi:MAG TPA: extracellular solute-binding protein [Microvirga sp.]|jgi:iron(III) transport system substrate-binding protein|nr:extracellular solute-binding protein [Microvirga sp.]